MKTISSLITSLTIAALAQTINAQNPIVQTWCTTDPAPFVHNDTLYVYTGHDEDGADFFWMQEWRVYSTTDMVNWTDHGSPLALESFDWAKDRAWAAQLCERNGKFYWYICAVSKLTNTMAIGVAEGDTPTGPFHDAIGKPLCEGSWDYIDPTVLIDDDGRAYLYWGNPELYYVELNEDMVSYKGEVQHFEMTPESFGGPSMHARRKMMEEAKARGEELKTPSTWVDSYTEGPWISKRNGKYYMLYAAGGVPEHIAYSMSDHPLGPWTYKGIIMPQSNSNAQTGAVGTDSFTNHCGVIDYKGHSYFFYHNGWLGGGFGRAVAVEEFKYNADGTFPTINPTREGITQPLGTLNPYQRVEAETMAYSKGLKAEQTDATGVYISEIHNGDWMQLRCVDFGTPEADEPQREVKVRAASGLRGGQIEMHLDSLGGTIIATIDITGTGGWEQWQSFKAPLTQKVSGTHDLFLAFKGRKGPKLFNLDYWQISTPVRNLWFWSDVPDPDIIRVGEYYYLVSTTMHLMPGAPVMRSKDLVTWETVSYLFDQIHDTPRYDLTTPYQVGEEAKGDNSGGIGFGEGNDAIGTVYGRGQWATSIRYHEFKTGPLKGEKLFFALFTANDAPHKSWLYKTDDPAKGWTLVARLPHYHDASLMFDDDDRCYVYYDGGDVKLARLSEDLTQADPAWEIKNLHTRQLMPMGLLEGSRAFKHDGYYYLSMIAWPQSGRQQICYRSKSIDGPYDEMKVILKSKFGGWNFVGQGTVVDGKDGEWYGVIFQDRDGVGRSLTLSPCEWVDGWPLIGNNPAIIPAQGEGIDAEAERYVPAYMQLYPEATATTAYTSNLSSKGYISITKSDEFDQTTTLGSMVPLWQWNHNPVDSVARKNGKMMQPYWTLNERPGYLRLYTVDSSLQPAGEVTRGAKFGLYQAHNTLTQRMEGPTCAGAILLDIRKMKDGDRAGFAAFNGHSGVLTIERNGSKTYLVLTHEEIELTNQEHALRELKREEVARIDISGKKQVALRITGDFQPGHNDNATFWYNLDGSDQWTQIGGDYRMRFDYRRLFMGTKFAIFNYSTKQSGGYVDVDWFHYQHEVE